MSSPKSPLLLLLLGFLLLCASQMVLAAPSGNRDDAGYLSDDLIHYALHAVHPNFKDGVFASNKQALEALEQVDKPLASKVYALAKRQANNTITTTTPVSNQSILPPTTPVEPTTPFVTTSTSSFQEVFTSNGVQSTRTAVTVVIETVTPSANPPPAISATSNVTPELQSRAVRMTGNSRWAIALVALSITFGTFWR